MAAIVTTSTILLVFLVTVSPASSTSQQIQSYLFRYCPQGLIASTLPPQEEATLSSHLDCMLKCGEVSNCQGVNVCPGERTGQVRCQLTGKVLPESCDGLDSAASSHCFYAMKDLTNSSVFSGDPNQMMAADQLTETTLPGATTTSSHSTHTTTGEVTLEANAPTTLDPIAEVTTANDGGFQTTTEIICQNGGTPDGDSCQCPKEKSGLTCEREIRDCSDMYENGYTDPSNDGYYSIKPLNAMLAFMVKCEFDEEGWTYPLMSTSMSLNRDWNDCRDGWVNSYDTQPNFFTGLRNLRDILDQAQYDLHIVFAYRQSNTDFEATAVYRNVTIGSEAESFEMRYSSFDAAQSTADNGFSPSPPIKFSANNAPDSVQRACYDQKNGVGWYGANCTGYRLFADDKKWPVNGSDITYSQLHFQLTRTADFTDE